MSRVHIQINAIKLTESDEVGANKDAQLAALELALLKVEGIVGHRWVVHLCWCQV